VFISVHLWLINYAPLCGLCVFALNICWFRSSMKKILIIADYYLPGFESGGAARTLANMVDRLGDRFDFRLICRDHDGVFNRESYTSVNIGEWNTVGNVRVYYLKKDEVKAGRLRQLINETRPDAIYLNSFFSRLTIFTLALLKFRRIAKTPVILAPEGEFSPGALEINSLKKNLFIPNAKAFLLSNDIIWKAASESEKLEITNRLGPGLDIRVAPNMPPRIIFPEYDQTKKRLKKSGEAKMVFLSRMMRKKNLNWLLEKLGSIKGNLAIDIYGTLEEPDYWEECQRLTAVLPSNIIVNYCGKVAHDQVSETLFEYDFFVLPTLGENFGHVFIEALAAGLPLLISDRTPWRDLEEKGIGWDLSLEDPEAWLRAVQACVYLSGERSAKMSSGARSFAVEWLRSPEIERSNIELFAS
jgi:glycosyltransferase involved in cell wall biosynthesis